MIITAMSAMKSEAKFAGFVKVTPPVRLRVVVAVEGECTSGSKTSMSPGGHGGEVPVVIEATCPV